MGNSLRKILGSGIPPLASQNISGDFANALSAAGTTQATATLIQADNNEFTTVSSGSGVILNFNNAPADETFVANAQPTNALLVYPEVGSSINALSANTGFSIPAGGRALFVKLTPTKYYALLSA